MKFYVDLARDLARDLSVVASALAVIFAVGWIVLRRRDTQSGPNSKSVPD
jgi:hypothetical protein